MNWASVDFDWNHARAFLATAREGSLSAAARALKQTQPTLGRQISALEEELGVTLFERVGKTLQLTETGGDLLEHVQTMAEAAGLVSLRASGRSQMISGEVRISAGEAISAYLLPAIVEDIRKLYPQLTLDLVVSNEISDLLRREADIAIRHVRPEQSDLVAKKVFDSSAHLFVSQTWLDIHGRPQNLQELSQANFVGVDKEGNRRFAVMLRELGLDVSEKNFGFTTHSHLVGWELVRRGLGVGAMVREVAKLQPEVVEVMPELAGIPVPFWLCAHREVHTSRRIRLVFDHLADALSKLAHSS